VKSDTTLPVPISNKEMVEVIVASAHDLRMLAWAGVEDNQGGCMKRVGRVEHFNRVRLL
jgi:hypothetical protein